MQNPVRYLITPQTYKIFSTPQNKIDEIHLFMQFIDFFVIYLLCIVVLTYICGRNLKQIEIMKTLNNIEFLQTLDYEASNLDENVKNFINDISFEKYHIGWQFIRPFTKSGTKNVSHGLNHCFSSLEHDIFQNGLDESEYIDFVNKVKKHNLVDEVVSEYIEITNNNLLEFGYNIAL